MKTTWQLTVLYFGLIIFIIYLANQNSINTDRLSAVIPYFDKVGHFALMGMAAFLLNLSLRCKQILFFNHPILLGSVIVACLVTLEEGSQLFLTYRSFDLLDLSADFLGIYVFGQLALWLYTKRQGSQES